MSGDRANLVIARRVTWALFGSGIDSSTSFCPKIGNSRSVGRAGIVCQSLLFNRGYAALLHKSFEGFIS